jgi:hypothetical protein
VTPRARVPAARPSSASRRARAARRAALAAGLPAALALLVGSAPSWAQEGGASGAGAQDVPAPFDTTSGGPWPFGVGELATYAVTFGPVRVGTASLAVEAADTVRGTPAYRVAMEMRGGTFFYRLDDRQSSWIAPHPFRSLRFEQHLREGSFRRDRVYCLDQEAGRYRRFDRGEDGRWRVTPGDEELTEGMPMPPAALDEIAFLYFARTLPLEPGRSYRFARYFEADGNPVVLDVLRRETITVPAGRFRTIVVRPIIRTGGMFGEGGRAEVYFTDDERHVIVELATSMKVGRLNLYLKEYREGAPSPDGPGNRGAPGGPGADGSGSEPGGPGAAGSGSAPAQSFCPLPGGPVY